MKPLVLDANMLFARVDVCVQACGLGFTPVVLRSTIEEMNHIAARRGKAGMEARVALQVIASQRIPVRSSSTKEKGDAAIIRYAKENQCAVATNDRQLIKALQKMHITVMRLRQGKQLIEAHS